MKPPRNLPAYTTAEEAALGLEDMAAMLRAQAHARPLVKYTVRLGFWNPAWADKTKPQPLTIYTGVTYDNKPKAGTGK